MSIFGCVSYKTFATTVQIHLGAMIIVNICDILALYVMYVICSSEAFHKCHNPSNKVS